MSEFDGILRTYLLEGSLEHFYYEDGFFFLFFLGGLLLLAGSDICRSEVNEPNR